MTCSLHELLYRHITIRYNASERFRKPEYWSQLQQIPLRSRMSTSVSAFGAAQIIVRIICAGVVILRAESFLQHVTLILRFKQCSGISNECWELSKGVDSVFVLNHPNRIHIFYRWGQSANVFGGNVTIVTLQWRLYLVNYRRRHQQCQSHLCRCPDLLLNARSLLSGHLRQ